MLDIFLKKSQKQRSNILFLHLEPNYLAVESQALGDIEDAKFSLFCKAMTECVSMRHLDLTGNNMANFSPKRLIEFGLALHQCQSLHTIYLEQNHLNMLDETGLTNLYSALSKSNSLTKIISNELSKSYQKKINEICKKNHNRQVESYTLVASTLLYFNPSFPDEIRRQIYNLAFPNTREINLPKTSVIKSIPLNPNRELLYAIDQSIVKKIENKH